MTTLTDTQVVTASGGLVELGYLTRTSNLNVTATTAGTSQEVIAPITVVCDGGPILVEFFASKVYPASDQAAREIVLSLYEDGSEKFRQWGYQRNEATNGMPISPQYLSCRLTPSAGSHTYSVKSYVSGGTNAYIEAGTGGTGVTPAFLRVSKIVQATQWPAVTTGTIICTSTTRPASPFEGQQIYETDTDKLLIYNGSAWYPPWNMPWGSQSAWSISTTTSTTFGAAQDVTGMTTGSAFTGVSGRLYKATYYAAQLTGQAGERANITILAGATTIQSMYSSLSQYGFPISMTAVFTASGATTVKVRAVRDVGVNTPTLYADANSPMRLLIEDIGPA